MPHIIEGQYQGAGKRFALVAARFNSLITERLVEGAMDCLLRHGASDDNITLVRTPGSFEVPLVAKRLAAGGKFDAVICLTAVIRGGTPHFDYVAAEVSKGIAQVMLETGVPVIYGVITADTIEQAIERAGTKAGNRGWDAALTSLEMIDVMGQLPGGAS